MKKVFTKDETQKTVEPTAKYCQTCKHALPPVTIMGNVINRSAYMLCAKYDRKPQDVLWHYAKCDLYQEK